MLYLKQLQFLLLNCQKQSRTTVQPIHYLVRYNIQQSIWNFVKRLLNWVRKWENIFIGKFLGTGGKQKITREGSSSKLKNLDSIIRLEDIAQWIVNATRFLRYALIFTHLSSCWYQQSPCFATWIVRMYSLINLFLFFRFTEIVILFKPKLNTLLQIWRVQ